METNDDDLQDEDLDELVPKLVGDMIQAVDREGDLEAWALAHLDGSVSDVALHRSCTEAADQLLRSTPPQTGAWEHLLVTLALHSHRPQHHQSLGACQSILGHLAGFLNESNLERFDVQKLMTLAGAMSVALAIQYRLTQAIEETTCRLCERFPEHLPKIAEQCQDVWKRRGQSTGRAGLFLWDLRRQEWRLAQDLTPYRPTE